MEGIGLVLVKTGGSRSGERVLGFSWNDAEERPSKSEKIWQISFRFWKLEEPAWDSS